MPKNPKMYENAADCITDNSNKIAQDAAIMAVRHWSPFKEPPVDTKSI